MNLANLFDHPTSQHTDTPPKGTGGGAGNTPSGNGAPSSNDAIAEKLFGDAKPPAKAGDPPAEPAKADPAKVLFGDTLYRESEHALLPENNLDIPADQLAPAREAVRAELHKVELPAALAKSLTDQFIVAMRNPISDEQHAVARTAMHAELAQRFGKDGAREKLADVRALLAKSEHIADALVDAGLDVNTEVILKLAEHARSMRGSGRLA